MSGYVLPGAAFEDLDDAEAGEIEVVARIAVGAVRQFSSANRNTNALSTPSLSKISSSSLEVAGLAGLVALVLAVQPQRRPVTSSYSTTSMLRGATSPAPRQVAVPNPVIATRFGP